MTRLVGNQGFTIFFYIKSTRLFKAKNLTELTSDLLHILAVGNTLNDLMVRETVAIKNGAGINLRHFNNRITSAVHGRIFIKPWAQS